MVVQAMWTAITLARLCQDVVAPLQLKVFANFYIEALWNDETRESFRTVPANKLRHLPWNCVVLLSLEELRRWFPIAEFPHGPSATGYTRIALKWKTTYNLLFIQIFHCSKYSIEKLTNFGLTLVNSYSVDEEGQDISMVEDVVPNLKGL